MRDVAGKVDLFKGKAPAIRFLEATHRSRPRLALERSYPGRVQRPVVREKSSL